jgi:NAD(P)H dehydrogenase (quinone)
MGAGSSTIGVTGATGHLGGLVIEALLARGVGPSEIVALIRDPKKARGLAEHGVQLRQASYDDRPALDAALRGVDRLLLISSSELGQRALQHGNVVDAARAAGVGLVAYTSIVNADTNAMLLAAEHKATEEHIRASGVPFTMLRNSWYLEVYTEHLEPVLDRGVLLGCADDGRVSAAARTDYAEAAAAVLTGSGHENRAYELGGDDAFTLAELAEVVSRSSGRMIPYRNLPAAEYTAALVAAGTPEQIAHILVDTDIGIARDQLFTDSGDLRRLIGRATTPLRDAVRAALNGSAAA